MYMKGITEIDIIIISNAKNYAVKSLTERCINSIVASEDSGKIKFNIVIIQSQPNVDRFQYTNSRTFYPEQEFSYNRFLNIGIQLTSAKYVCLCTNDLVFHHYWATEMLKAFNKHYDLSSASPACSFHHPKMGFELHNGLYPGYRSQYELVGWCLFLKRDVFRIIGKLDENYKFWCRDNDYSNTLSVLRLRHALVSSSIVDHAGDVTSDWTITDAAEKLTSNEFFYFAKKWGLRRDLSTWTEIQIDLQR